METQSIKHQYVGSRLIPFILILVTNILGGLHYLPIFTQLLINSTSCVFLGAVLAGRLNKNQGGKMVVSDKAKGQSQKIGQKEALRFPIVASCFLFGFYLIYKFVNKDVVNFIITLQFCITTVISTSNLLEQAVAFPKNLKKVIKHVKPYEFLKKYLEFQDFDISPASIICNILCAIPVAFYYVTKHWTLNNVFGILFSIFALRNIQLSDFKVGFMLLWLLFFYDIFWVYGTDVMVSVAKNLDIPIKLLFPFLNAEGVQMKSMLGLGDIVLPGIFVSLCLKFDIDNTIEKKAPKSTKQFKKPYFIISVVGYIVGMCATFAAMYIFDHAQPALLFLVPGCTLSVLILALVRGEISHFLSYQSAAHQKRLEQQKKTQ